MNDERIVMNTDDDSARLMTVTGWVDRHGRFFGNDERTARWSGSTHVACSHCGAPVEKTWTLCAPCRVHRAAAKHAARPKAEWDGEQMVYSEALDRYYSSPDEAIEYAPDGVSLEDLRLVLCVPVYAQELTDDYFTDALPEDGDLPDELAAAVEAFNLAVRGVVLSWEPGAKALMVVR